MEKVIKNCRGVKKSNDGVNRMEKRNQRENFRSFWGFKKKWHISKKGIFNIAKSKESVCKWNKE